MVLKISESKNFAKNLKIYKEVVLEQRQTSIPWWKLNIYRKAGCPTKIYALNLNWKFELADAPTDEQLLFTDNLYASVAFLRNVDKKVQLIS